MDPLTYRRGLLACIAPDSFRPISDFVVNSKGIMAKQAVLLLIRALLIGLALNFTIDYAANLSPAEQSDQPDVQTQEDSMLNHTPSTTQWQSTK